MTILSTNLAWLCSNLFNINEMKILQPSSWVIHISKSSLKKKEVQNLADAWSLKALAAWGQVYK